MSIVHKKKTPCNIVKYKFYNHCFLKKYNTHLMPHSLSVHYNMIIRVITLFTSPF